MEKTFKISLTDLKSSSMKVKLISENLEVIIKLFENPTVKAIVEKFPLKSTVSTWGDEIYFDTGINAPVSKLTTDVSVGDVAYWPEGRCFCVFFGKTPMSTSNKPMPASSVVVIGKTEALHGEIKKVASGSEITVQICD